ncbi:MAG: hypothetical protein ACOYMG_30240, partial [Candidatus Methylumidiphilus sp.]
LSLATALPYFIYRGEILRIWLAQALDENPSASPGEVLPNRKTLDVVTGSGVLRVLELQLPGGKRLNASDFLNAHPLKNVRFGSKA